MDFALIMFGGLCAVFAVFGMLINPAQGDASARGLGSKLTIEQVAGLLSGWSDSEFAVAASGEFGEDLKAAIEGALGRAQDTITALRAEAGDDAFNQRLDNIIARLDATYSHRGDGFATQYVNPDGAEAIAVIQGLAADVARLREALDLTDGTDERVGT